MSREGFSRHVVVVGGGFAGIACAKGLSVYPQVRVTLIDKNNFHQFQPLLYQLATSQLSSADITYSLRKIFIDTPNVDVKLAEVTAVDPSARTATTADGQTYRGDYLVLAAGARANFFNTPGADKYSFPLYSLDDGQRLRSRILQVFEDADRNPKLIAEGALNFVVVGAGPTGVEMSGALAEMIHDTMPNEYRDLAVSAARIYLIDHGHAVLAAFSEKAHDYAAKVLQRAGVQIRLGTGVSEVAPGHVVLSDGSVIKTRVVVWAGGLMAAAVAGKSGLVQGRGGRIDVQPDLTATGFPHVYALGDVANIPGASGTPLPQLGSVALQAGEWAAKNILADIAGQPRTAFHYHDKGIMAMINRHAAIAEIGESRHELHGQVAAAAWLGVHAALLTGVRPKVEAFVQWTSSYFSKDRGPQILDRSDAARINWGDDTAIVLQPPPAKPEEEPAQPPPPPLAAPTEAAAYPASRLAGVQDRTYDVIVIGTGAGGGTLAHRLAASGKRVLLLERGDFLPREKENWDPSAVFGQRRYVSVESWLDAEGKPFQPGVHYFVGGATKLTGAALFRLRTEDFGELRHHGGVSPAWPIKYDEMEPYYTQAEKLFQVHGLRGTDPTEPPASGPYPHPPVEHEPHVQNLSDRLTKLGLHPFHIPSGLLLSEKYRSMSTCIKCDTCEGYPCLVHAKTDAEVSCVRPALAHKNVTLVTGAKVLRLTTDAAGKAVTEVVVDRDGEPLSFKGHVVVLAAGAVNSAKVLLQSASDKHPKGLANGSDQVGRNVMFQTTAAVTALSRQANPTVFQKTLAVNDYYLGADDFPHPLGHIQLAGRSKVTTLRPDAANFFPGWTQDLIARHALDFWLISEDLPDAKNRVTLTADGTVKLEYTPNNAEPAKRLLAKLTALLPKLDCHPTPIPAVNGRSPATVAHQAGTCRMGTDPKTSVVDASGKAHDLENLYVVDASVFPSVGAMNPALTVSANALRVGDRLLERLR
ncbi:MAG: FAD-dependent oxidoreductase [Gemmataceae bacterium]